MFLINFFNILANRHRKKFGIRIRNSSNFKSNINDSNHNHIKKNIITKLYDNNNLTNYNNMNKTAKSIFNVDANLINSHTNINFNKIYSYDSMGNYNFFNMTNKAFDLTHDNRKFTFDNKKKLLNNDIGIEDLELPIRDEIFTMGKDKHQINDSNNYIHKEKDKLFSKIQISSKTENKDKNTFKEVKENIYCPPNSITNQNSKAETITQLKDKEIKTKKLSFQSDGNSNLNLKNQNIKFGFSNLNDNFVTYNCLPRFPFKNSANTNKKIEFNQVGNNQIFITIKTIGEPLCKNKNKTNNNKNFFLSPKPINKIFEDESHNLNEENKSIFSNLKEPLKFQNFESPKLKNNINPIKIEFGENYKFFTHKKKNSQNSNLMNDEIQEKNLSRNIIKNSNNNNDFMINPNFNRNGYNIGNSDVISSYAKGFPINNSKDLSDYKNNTSKNKFKLNVDFSNKTESIKNIYHKEINSIENINLDKKIEPIYSKTKRKQSILNDPFYTTFNIHMGDVYLPKVNCSNTYQNSFNEKSQNYQKYQESLLKNLKTFEFSDIKKKNNFNNTGGQNFRKTQHLFFSNEKNQIFNSDKNLNYNNPLKKLEFENAIAVNKNDDLDFLNSNNDKLQKDNKNFVPNNYLIRRFLGNTNTVDLNKDFYESSGICITKIKKIDKQKF